MAGDLLFRMRMAFAPRELDEQKMFGGTCFMLNGNMVAGTSSKGEILIRVGKDGMAAALARPHARPMVNGERTMQGFIWVHPDGIRSDADLKAWLDFAEAYVATLPPKVKTAKASSRRA